MRQYVVDAFTDRIFSGNPAAICVLERWPEQEEMMAIAVENNLSETAFTVKEGDKYHLRWFTPGGEIDLCGHATLACAYVLLNYYEKNAAEIDFTTMSGELAVRKSGELYEMRFPAYDLKPLAVTDEMETAYGIRPAEAFMGRDLLCVFEREEDVRALNPDPSKLKLLPGLLQHATAKGEKADCVSRSFGPKLNIFEDPVCGSGHCHVIPYWSKILGKDILTAYQASKRGGTLYCRQAGDTVYLAGKAALYSVAELNVQ